MTMKAHSVFFIAGIAILQFANAVWAQSLPSARLGSVFPAGGKQGATVDVTVTGTDLDEVKSLGFSHAGITSKPKADAAGQPLPGQYTVTIAANVPPGIYDATVGGGRYGTSNARAFAIGDLAEVNLTAATTPETAMAVPIGTVVNGQAASRAYHHFKFTAKAGQRVLIECAAQELDSKLEPVFVVRDAGGRELERSRRGAAIDFAAPADGEYQVLLHDFIYGGDAEHVYRLAISQRPQIDFIVPPIGEAGKAGQFTLYGRNLPAGQPAPQATLNGKPLFMQVVTITMPGDAAARATLGGAMPAGPAQATLDGIEYRLPSPNGTSNPVRVYFADAPVIAETAQPNDKPDQAQKLTVPCDVAGRFFPRRDRDWMTFDAKKGEAYQIEMVAERLGAPVNPFLRVERVTKAADGKELVTLVKESSETPSASVSPVFNTSTPDPAFRFEATEDGTYRLLTFDLYNQGAPDALYRLSIRKEAPDFRLVAMLEPTLGAQNQPVGIRTAFLRCGDVLPVRVFAFRRDSFVGDIELSVAGLPAQITAGPSIIRAGSTGELLLLQATTNAATWAGRITITGKAKINGADVTREARTADVTSITNDQQANRAKARARLTSGLQLTVTAGETAPVALAPAENKVWENCVFNTMQIPLKITADVGFKEVEKDVLLHGHGVLAQFKAVKVAKDKADAPIELNLTTYKLPAGTHTLYFQSQMKGKYKKDSDASVAAAKDVQKKADDAATAAIAALKVATDAQVVVDKNTASTPAQKAEAKKKSDDAATVNTTADTAKKAAAAVVARVTEGNKAKDATATVYSAPFTVKITESPIELKPVAAVSTKQGDKLEITVNIVRKYAFNDPVTLAVNLPKGSTGFTVAQVTIDKDKTDGKLTIAVGEKATIGDLALELEASVKVQTQTIKVTQPLPLKVAEVKK